MSMSELNTQLEYLAETKEQIKTAITNKGQDITSSVPFREYVDKINNISTLQVDTADANAKVGDIVKGKTAYVNGEKITGTLRESASVFFRAEAVTLNDEHNIVKSQGPNNYSDERVVMSSGATGWTEIPYQTLADTIGVTAEKIVQGNTILGIEGTASSGSGQVLNFVETTLNYTQPINSIPQEISLSATIEANIGDYVKLKYNIPLGEDYGTESGQCGILIGKVISNVENTLRLNIIQKYTATNLAGGLSCGLDHIVTDTGYDGSFIEIHSIEQQNGPAYFETPTYEITISSQMSEVAAAIGLTADKITSGNTILGIEGTATAGIDTSDATATSGDLAINKTAYVNGEKITGTLPLFPNTSTFTVSNAGVTNNTEDSTLDLTTINTTKQILDSNVSMNFNADYSEVATAIGLTADRIVEGNTILGIEGTATTGTMADIIIAQDEYGLETATSGEGDNDIGYKFFTTANTQSKLYNIGSIVELHITNELLAQILGITADKIKKDEVICGITGTYEGAGA